MSQEPVHSKTAINEFLETDEALLTALVSTCIAQSMTLHLMYQHRKTKTEERVLIMNILAFVPLYGFFSFLPGSYSDTFEYVLYENVRQFYGAYAMYEFLMLCYEYLGGEENVMSELSGRPVAAWCINKKVTWIYTHRFHRFCKYTVLSFLINKAICVLSVGILKWWYDYRENDLSDFGYLTLTLDSMLFADVGLCGLALFTGAVRNLIEPDPSLKFLVVTMMVLLTYWQGVALAILENVGLITSATDARGQPLVGRVSTNCHHFLVLVEMVVAAIALRIAFPAPGDQPAPTTTMEKVSANSQATVVISLSIDSPHDHTVSLNGPLNTLV